jgi:hypothetical protein
LLISSRNPLAVLLMSALRLRAAMRGTVEPASSGLCTVSHGRDLVWNAQDVEPGRQLGGALRQRHARAVCANLDVDDVEEADQLALRVALLRGGGGPPRIAVPRLIDTSHEGASSPEWRL